METCFNFLNNFQDWKNDNGNSDAEELEQKIKRCKYSKDVEVMWKYNFSGCVDASPLIFRRGGRTYVGVGSFSNSFAILDALTGEVKFHEKFPDSIGSEASVSPCLNFLYFGCFDGKLYCVSLKDYTIIWSYQTNDSVKSKPSFCLNHKAVVFGSYDKHIYCVTVETGKIIWKKLIQESMVTVPQIHVEKKQIIVTTLSSSCISIFEETGEILWQIKLKTPIFSSPDIIGNSLLCCDVLGNIYCINLESGHILGSTEIEGEIYSSIRYMKNHFIIASTKGILYKCNLINDSTVDVVKSLYLGNSISATPAIFENNHRIFTAVFTSSGEFYLVNLENMEITNYWKCPGEVYSSCVFSENKLYVGCRDNHLYCLDMSNI